MYNITNVTDGSNTILEVVTNLNTTSNNLLISMLMVVLFFGFLITFKKQDIKKVLLADSFFMIVVCGMAWALGFVAWSFIIIPLILFGAMLIAFMFVTRD